MSTSSNQEIVPTQKELVQSRSWADEVDDEEEKPKKSKKKKKKKKKNKKKEK